MQLPDGFGQLAELEYLELLHNQIVRLPQDFCQLTHLQGLILFDNKLSSLPTEIGKLSNLKTLYLNSNQLSKLPESIGQWANLEELSLSDNQLTAIPASFCFLKKLKSFAAFKNPLKEWPDCLNVKTYERPLMEPAEPPIEDTMTETERAVYLQKKAANSYQFFLARAQFDTTNVYMLHNLSFYALFVGEYAKAIEAAQKTLELDSRSVEVETNLALGYLLNNQYDKAEVIYLKWKGKKFKAQDENFADKAFLKDIADLEAAGIFHKDFEKVKRLLSE